MTPASRSGDVPNAPVFGKPTQSYMLRSPQVPDASYQRIAPL